MPTIDDFNQLYPLAAIRCRRIFRDTERPFGDVRLDGETAMLLGESNLGVLAGHCPPRRDLMDKLHELANCELPGQIVVALSSTDMAITYFDAFRPDALSKRPDWWTFGILTFTTPEKLGSLGHTQLAGRPVLAVVLIDPPGIVYRARGGNRGGYHGNDRPQHIARFRAAHALGEWRPPFWLLTEQPAKSLSSDQMLTAYSLDGWYFVDGSAIRMGSPPHIDARESEPFCEVAPSSLLT